MDEHELPLKHIGVEDAVELVTQAEERDAKLRIIGGVAVALHSPSAAEGSLGRRYADVDFVLGTGGGPVLDELLASHGYMPDRRFNSVHGRRRRLYFDESGSHQVDVFVGSFEMCHKLPLHERLAIDSPTIPLAELFLSKAQIVQLNHKDVLDLLALLADHSIESGDDDVINADRVAELAGADWGLWRTLQGTIETLSGALAEAPLEQADKERVAGRIDEVRKVLDEAPRSRRWKLRAKVGERMQWYELPEDPRRPAKS